MKTRQKGYGDNGCVSLDRPMSRSILLQRHVRAGLVVVRRMGGENSPQVRFAKSQHLVEALAAQGADQTFRKPQDHASRNFVTNGLRISRRSTCGT